MTAPKPGMGPHTTQRMLRHLPVILLLLVAWATYRPEVARPFDYVDFPEDVRVLKAHDGFVDQYVALSRVYVDHGRWKPVMNALLAGQWSLFGNWTTGWQLTRFAVMVGALFAAWSLMWKLRLDATGAFAACALLLFSPPATMGWLRLSTPEPIGVLLLAIACHVALGERSQQSAWMLALLLVSVMWTKEIMTVAFSLPLLLVLASNGDGTLGRLKYDPERLRALAPGALAGILAAVPVIYVWYASPPESFAARYAGNGISSADLLGGSLAAWLPFAPLPQPSSAALLVASTVFLLLLLSGWHQALRKEEPRIHHQAILLLALFVPVLGALFYSLWPYYLLVYAMPFGLAGSLITGQAVSSLRDKRVLSLACLTIVLTFSLAQAANESSRLRALHGAFAESVTRVQAMQSVDTVLVEIAPDQYDQRGNFGPRFKTYAWMLGLNWPEVRDVPCGAGEASQSGVIRLQLNLMCPGASAEPAIVKRFARFDWPDPRPRRDSVTVSFVSQ